MSAETFGQAFSQTAVTHETRLEQLTNLEVKVRALRRAIQAEIKAENEAADWFTAEHPGEWDDYRSNNVDAPTDANGINVPVQLAAEALWTEVDDLS